MEDLDTKCWPSQSYPQQLRWGKLRWGKHSSLTIPVRLRTDHESFIVTTLIDSGVATNLIAQHLMEEFNLPTIPCATPLRVMSIDQLIREGYTPDHPTHPPSRAFSSSHLLHHPLSKEPSYPRLPLGATPQPLRVLEKGGVSMLVSAVSKIQDPISCPCLATSLKSPIWGGKTNIPREYDLEEVFSKQKSVPPQQPGIVPLTCYLMLCPLRAGFTLSHSREIKPWYNNQPLLEILNTCWMFRSKDLLIKSRAARHSRSRHSMSNLALKIKDM